MMKNKLVKNTIYLYIFTIVKILIPLVTLPYFTRVLSMESYGIVAFVKSYILYVQLFIDFGFIFSATKEIVINKEDKEKQGIILGNTLLEKAFLGVIASLFTICFVNRIDIMCSNKEFVYLYVLSCLLTILIPDFYFRGIEQMEYVTIPFACSKVVTLLLTFVLVKNDSQYMYIPKLEILGNIISVIVSLYFLCNLKIKIRTGKLEQIVREVKESSIYFLSNFATTLFGAMTTLLVGIYMDKVDVALWSICIQIVSAVKALYAPIVNSIYPYMVVSKDIKMVKKIAGVFSIPVMVGVLWVFIFGEEMLTIIGGINYSYSGYILKFLTPVFVFSFYSMLLGWPVLGAVGKVKETTISTIIAASIQMIGIILLIITSNLKLVTLAMCCNVAEVSLLLIRGYIYSKTRNGL